MTDYLAIAQGFRDQVLSVGLDGFMEASEFYNDEFTCLLRYDISENIEKAGLSYEETVKKFSAVHLQTALMSYMMGKFASLSEAGECMAAGSVPLGDNVIAGKAQDIERIFRVHRREDYPELMKNEPIHTLLTEYMFDRLKFAKSWYKKTSGCDVKPQELMMLHRSLWQTALDGYAAGKEFGGLYVRSISPATF